MSKVVFRVENEAGTGPYRLTGSYELLNSHDKDPIDHPLPWLDGIEDVNDGWKFGFKSIKRLMDWFKMDELKELYKSDFSCFISIYRVTHVKHGKRQSVFNPKTATLLTRYRLEK